MKTVGDLLGKREVFSVRPELSVKETVSYLCERGVGAIAVCDGDEVVGVFSERDLLQRVVHKNLNPDEINVGDVMTREVFCVRTDETHAVARALMLDKNFRHLVVLDEDEHLRGFISMRELLEEDLAQAKGLVQKLNDDYYQYEFKQPKK